MKSYLKWRMLASALSGGGIGIVIGGSSVGYALLLAAIVCALFSLADCIAISSGVSAL